MDGLRMPPSYRSRLIPRRPPALLKSFENGGFGPLSLAKKTRVFSSMFSSFKRAMIFPMLASMRVIIDAYFLSISDHGLSAYGPRSGGSNLAWGMVNGTYRKSGCEA